MSDEVLIIHNAVGGTHFVESNAGLIQEVAAVAAALGTLGFAYDVSAIDSIEQLPAVLREHRQTVIINLVEELPQNIADACYVPAICRACGRVSTGSDTPALLLAQNKWQTKAVLRAHNIPTPNSALIPRGQPLPQHELQPGRYVVKPPFSDASEGIDADSIVDIPSKAVAPAVARIHERFHQPALVEQFIPHRELNVSVMERNGEPRVLAIAEIDFAAFEADKPRIVGYAAKWLSDSFEYNNTPRIIPAQLSKRAAKLVHDYAIDTWHAVGCRDYARVDFRMDDAERPFVLEVNPNPDISPDAGFAAALAAAGTAYEEFVRTLLDNAQCRLHSITRLDSNE